MSEQETTISEAVPISGLPPGEIRFNLVGKTEPVLKFCPNGEIYIHGRLATSDKEVVDGMRSFLHGLPFYQETVDLKAKLALAIRAIECIREADPRPDLSHHKYVTGFDFVNQQCDEVLKKLK